MKFNIPKIVKMIEMKEYAPEMAGAKLAVWVNPPVRLMERWDELGEQASEVREMVDGITLRGKSRAEIITDADQEMRKILSELWSQGAEELRWSVEEVAQLEQEARETDPKLMSWMVAATFRAIYEHRLQIKKV